MQILGNSFHIRMDTEQTMFTQSNILDTKVKTRRYVHIHTTYTPVQLWGLFWLSLLTNGIKFGRVGNVPAVTYVKISTTCSGVRQDASEPAFTSFNMWPSSGGWSVMMGLLSANAIPASNAAFHWRYLFPSNRATTISAAFSKVLVRIAFNFAPTLSYSARSNEGVSRWSWETSIKINSNSGHHLMVSEEKCGHCCTKHRISYRRLCCVVSSKLWTCCIQASVQIVYAEQWAGYITVWNNA